VVKLSDNRTKATGDAAEIARYQRLFGDAGRGTQPVVV
jgi:nicotinate phosphoribosyltransferase